MNGPLQEYLETGWRQQRGGAAGRKGAVVFDVRIERGRADRSIHEMMVNAWRGAAVMAIAVLGLAGLGLAILMFGE